VANLSLFFLDNFKNMFLPENVNFDLIVIYENKIFIFEHKYRHNRKNTQAKNAMKCINQKNYVPKVLEF
jgi:hypothetical protein